MAFVLGVLNRRDQGNGFFGYRKTIGLSSVNAVLVGGLSLFIAGNAFAKPVPPVSEATRNQAVALLQHTPLSQPVKITRVNGVSYCATFNVVVPVIDPETNKARDVEFMLTLPNSKNPVPVMIDVPTIEGVTKLDERMQDDFCSENIAMIIADVNPQEFPDEEVPALDWIDRSNRFSVHAVRTLIDWITVEKRFDPKKIGIIGLSLGGQVASFVGAVDSRISAVVIGASAGNTASILALSEQEKPAGFRKRQMRALGIKNVDQFEDAVRAAVKLDPMYVVGPEMKPKTKQFVVMKDVFVPTETQEELYEAMGQPLRENLTGSGHAWSLISLVMWNFDKVLSFVEDRFK